MEDTLKIFLDAEEYANLNKTDGETLKKFASVCEDLRNGVFKAASRRGLNDDETAVLFRACLIKTASENEYVRDLLKKTAAAFGPLTASDA
jgi:hypothetical protein